MNLTFVGLASNRHWSGTQALVNTETMIKFPVWCQSCLKSVEDSNGYPPLIHTGILARYDVERYGRKLRVNVRTIVLCHTVPAYF